MSKFRFGFHLFAMCNVKWQFKPNIFLLIWTSASDKRCEMLQGISITAHIMRDGQFKEENKNQRFSLFQRNKRFENAISWMAYNLITINVRDDTVHFVCNFINQTKANISLYELIFVPLFIYISKLRLKSKNCQYKKLCDPNEQIANWRCDCNERKIDIQTRICAFSLN